jgi:hypothetical protein
VLPFIGLDTRSFLDLVIDPAMAMAQPAARLPRFAEQMRFLFLERIDVMLAGHLLNQAFRGVEPQFFAHKIL